MSTKLDFNRLKYVTKTSKYIVLGYIRKAQTLLPSNNDYYNIPDGIINICILFFGFIYQIDEKYTSDNVDIQDNELKINEKSDPAFNNIYFKDIMECGKHELIFKIKSIKTQLSKYHRDFFIGIINVQQQKTKIRSAQKLEPDLPSYYLVGIDNWAKSLHNDKKAQIYEKSKYIKDYACWLQENDIIKMCVDFDSLELKFVINNVDYGVATKIEAGKYRVMIMMYDAGDCIQLL